MVAAVGLFVDHIGYSDHCCFVCLAAVAVSMAAITALDHGRHLCKFYRIAICTIAVIFFVLLVKCMHVLVASALDIVANLYSCHGQHYDHILMTTDMPVINYYSYYAEIGTRLSYQAYLVSTHCTRHFLHFSMSIFAHIAIAYYCF